MRWWHVAALLPIERELFAPEPWSERLFWSELGQLDTRHYVVAVERPGVVAVERPGVVAVERPGVVAVEPVGADGAVLGYAGLCDYPDEAFVQTLAVAPAAQGRGLGSLLLLELLAEAERRRQRVVSLEVRADNEPAQRLYARHGFSRTGVRRGYYPGSVDALVLTRRS
jgi:ribosomal-protein-alanine N-acetyltransferase